MFCEKCGSEAKEGSKFCGKCGNALKAPAIITKEENLSVNKPIPERPLVKEIPLVKADVSKNAPNVPKRKSNNSKIIMISAAASLIIAVVIVTVILIMPKASSEAVDGTETSGSGTESEQSAMDENSLDINYEEMVAEYNAILETEPTNVEALTGLGDAYTALGKANEAIEAYVKVYNIETGNIGVIQKIANLYKALGDNPNAAFYYERYLEIDKTSEDVYVECANVLTAVNELERAKQILEEAVVIFNTERVLELLANVKTKIDEAYMATLTPIDLGAVEVTSAVEYLTYLSFRASFQNQSEQLAPFENPKDIDPVYMIKAIDVNKLVPLHDENYFYEYPIDDMVELIRRDVNPEFEIPENFNYNLANTPLITWNEDTRTYSIIPAGGTNFSIGLEPTSAYVDPNGNIVLYAVEYEIVSEVAEGEYIYEEYYIDNIPVGHRSLEDEYINGVYETVIDETVFYDDKAALPGVCYTLKPMENGGYNILKKTLVGGNREIVPEVLPENDYVIQWSSEALKLYMKDRLGIHDREIMYSDIYEIEILGISIHVLTDEVYNDLTHFTSLKQLYMNYVGISDLTPLANLTNLTLLSLKGNQITDITPLAALTNLRSLDLSNNLIQDLSPLSSLSQLNHLFINNSLVDLNNTPYGITENLIVNLEPLQNLTNLAILDVSNNYVSDISPLSGLVNLRRLNISYNDISDISSLSSVAGMSYLNIESNVVADFSPVANLSYVNSKMQRSYQYHITDAAILGSYESVRDNLLVFYNPVAGSTEGILIYNYLETPYEYYFELLHSFDVTASLSNTKVGVVVVNKMTGMVSLNNEIILPETVNGFLI